MTPILQNTLPYDAAPSMPLPGVRPLDPEKWLIRDEAFELQIALKADLLRTRRPDVLAETPGSEDAQQECLDDVLQHLRDDHGVRPKPRSQQPLIALSEVAQEDFVIKKNRVTNMCSRLHA